VAARGGDGGNGQGGGLYVGSGTFSLTVGLTSNGAIGGAGGPGGPAADPVTAQPTQGGLGGNGGNAQGGGIFHAGGSFAVTTARTPPSSLATVAAGTGGPGGVANGVPGADGTASDADTNLPPLAVLSGTVFNDINRNGLFEPADEPSVPLDTVTLLDASNNPLGENSGGFYQYWTNYAGQASLQFGLPNGLQFSRPSTGSTAPFTLQAGATLTFNAGLFSPIDVHITPVSPSPRSTPAGLVTVRFTAPVHALGGFSATPSDFFRLTRDGQPVDLTGLNVTALDSTPAMNGFSNASQYTVDLTPFTGAPRRLHVLRVGRAAVLREHYQLNL
jgi:hypothetical protein